MASLPGGLTMSAFALVGFVAGVVRGIASRRLLGAAARTGLPVLGAVLLGLAAMAASQAATTTRALADDTPSDVPVVPGQSAQSFDIAPAARAQLDSALGLTSPSDTGSSTAQAAPSPSSAGLLSGLGLTGPAKAPAPQAPAPQAPARGSLAPVVDSVAGLTAPAPQPAAGPISGLLGIGPADSASAPQPGPVGSLLQGISSLVLPQPVQAAPSVPDAPIAPSAQPAGSDLPAMLFIVGASTAAHEGIANLDSGARPALSHAPTHPPFAPAPQPTGPQSPAGGSLGVSQIPGLGMAVAAFLFVSLLLSLATRRPRFTAPVLESVRIVALIERPG
jgi:hypothetical protein